MSLSSIIRGTATRSFSVRAALADKGSGGSIREAGGIIADREAAQENVYFKKLEAEQLKELQKKHDSEIEHHEKEIERHRALIKRHQEQAKKLQKKD